MRIRPLTAIALAVAPLGGAAIAAAASTLAGAAQPSAATRTTPIKTGLSDYRIALSKSRVLPGKVRFNLSNNGDAPHNLQVTGPRGSASKRRGKSQDLQSGDTARLTVTLSRTGSYRLICTIGDHADQGMDRTLRVVKKL